jgi:SAM-dependent methyltransferase
MLPLELNQTRCAICGTLNNSKELYPANFASQAFNPAVFSARRLPDLLHYRIVKCCKCGLVRSDPIADVRLLEKLYKQSVFSYEQDVANLQSTYGRYLKKLENYIPEKKRLLEIGCGNGFFLEEALRQGYQEIKGVEPSEGAISLARPEIKPHITCGTMQSGLFERDYFDVICMFQLFDHVPDPNGFLESCVKVLKPGGFLLSINHNVEAFSAKIMGEKSPIVDIEHTFLYSPKTMGILFKKYSLKVIESGYVTNHIGFYSLTRLLPIPKVMKTALLGILKKSRAGSLNLSLPLGNLYIISEREI